MGESPEAEGRKMIECILQQTASCSWRGFQRGSGKQSEPEHLRAIHWEGCMGTALRHRLSDADDSASASLWGQSECPWGSVECPGIWELRGDEPKQKQLHVSSWGRVDFTQ